MFTSMQEEEERGAGDGRVPSPIGLATGGDEFIATAAKCDEPTGLLDAHDIVHGRVWLSTHTHNNSPLS